ncbi:hypothetical protein P8452_14888 [Trifolium repens]|nr:hypothetical protein P8452_14888 [Trifolium repens]
MYTRSTSCTKLPSKPYRSVISRTLHGHPSTPLLNTSITTMCSVFSTVRCGFAIFPLLSVSFKLSHLHRGTDLFRFSRSFAADGLLCETKMPQTRNFQTNMILFR